MEKLKTNLTELSSGLVLGRDFAPRTPHVYAHPIISRMAEIRADNELQDTIEFPPITLPAIAELYPDLPETLAA